MMADPISRRSIERGPEELIWYSYEAESRDGGGDRLIQL